VLANILRPDRAAHRPLPADSELAQAIAALARARQDAVWNRRQITNQLRSLLREYHPAFLDNRFLGCLHYCLRTRQLFAEDTAFPAAVELAA
jgi:transposase